MEKIDGFIEKLYGNGQMLQFYLILGSIALFFVVLIVITLIQSKSSSKKAAAVSKEKTEVSKEETKEEMPTSTEEELQNNKIIYEDEPEETEKEKLTDTEVFNNILLDNNEENHASALTPSPVDNPKIIEEEPKAEEETVENDFFIEKETTVEEPQEESIEEVSTEEVEPEPENEVEVEKPTEDKTISELFNEPVIEEDTEFEEALPDVQSVEIEEVSSLSEPEEDKGPIILTNDEIENRLAKLKKSHEETEEDHGLADLMKAVGLEDTMVIPEINDEETKLTR